MQRIDLTVLIEERGAQLNVTLAPLTSLQPDGTTECALREAFVNCYFTQSLMICKSLYQNKHQYANRKVLFDFFDPVGQLIYVLYCLILCLVYLIYFLLCIKTKTQIPFM